MALADNDVLQGLQMFQQSVSRLAQTRAIQDARDQVDAVHQSTLDEDQKAQAFKQLGQQFAFNAALSGMPVTEAEGLAKQIAPPSRFYQTAEQALVNEKPGSRVAASAQDAFDQKQSNAVELERMKEDAANWRAQYAADATSGKADQKRRDNQNKALDGMIDNFTKQPDIKPLIETRNKINEIQAIDDSKLSDSSVGFNLMKKGLARLAEGGGKLTDQDYEIIQGSPDVKTRTRRYIESASTGKPLPEDVAIVREAAKVLGNAASRRLQEASQNYADSKTGIFDTLPSDAIQSRVRTRLGFSAQPAAPAPAYGAANTPGSFAPPPGNGGMLEQGNINLNNRPRVRNPDGTISTVRSTSVNIDGQEILLPTISDDGHNLTVAEAVRQYKQTGKHLGKFSDPQSATEYAQRLHEQQAAALKSPQPAPTPGLRSFLE
jgi:hypothetical protein